MYIKTKIRRIGRAFVIFCALIFGIFLVSVYSPGIWYFWAGLTFIAAGGIGTIISLFLTFHPEKIENNTDVTKIK